MLVPGALCLPKPSGAHVPPCAQVFEVYEPQIIILCEENNNSIVSAHVIFVSWSSVHLNKYLDHKILFKSHLYGICMYPGTIC